MAMVTEKLQWIGIDHHRAEKLLRNAGIRATCYASVIIARKSYFETQG